MIIVLIISMMSHSMALSLLDNNWRYNTIISSIQGPHRIDKRVEEGLSAGFERKLRSNWRRYRAGSSIFFLNIHFLYF